MVITVPNLGGRILYSAKQKIMAAPAFGSREARRVFLEMQRKSKRGFLNRLFSSK